MIRLLACRECKALPRMEDYRGEYRAVCPSWHCWEGPRKGSPQKAARSWNRVMKVPDHPNLDDIVQVLKKCEWGNDDYEICPVCYEPKEVWRWETGTSQDTPTHKPGCKLKEQLDRMG